MPDETQKERHAPHVLTTLAGVLIAFLLLAAIYVVYQAAHILFPHIEHIFFILCTNIMGFVFFIQ